MRSTLPRTLMGAVSYLGRRLKPTLLKIDAIHQRLWVCYLLGDADVADGDVIFLLPLLM
jgi:hypothetical protein